jgi:hypothetical protein
VQEINNSTNKVETELAARDMARLKRMLQLESVRVETEMMQDKLDHGNKEEREMTAEELLLEQDPEVRLAQLEAEMLRVREMQAQIEADKSQKLEEGGEDGEALVNPGDDDGEDDDAAAQGQGKAS